MSEIHDKTFTKFDGMGVEKVDLLYRTNGFHVTEREPANQWLQRNGSNASKWWQIFEQPISLRRR